MRVQRGQRHLDRQREAVAVLERADRDATMAKRLLKILEKALAVHIADRDRLTKRRARITPLASPEPDHALHAPQCQT